MSMNETYLQAASLPKQFSLFPLSQGFEVNVAKTCVGYVWTDKNRWLAKNAQGKLLDTGSGESVYEAVSALFQSDKAVTPL